MKDSVKANLIVFLIIGLIAFGISSAFASLTIHEDNDSYKLIPIENDSFEPNYINKVPTIIPKVENNITHNITNNTTDYDINDTVIDTDDLEEENLEIPEIEYED
ncbi:hypothetical protein [Methanobrevibacter sp.]|uniref:hypothetical protein n=1 Tax=Methanobrevibacter sp. TaxID=66852 RepID=UPI00386CBB7A